MRILYGVVGEGMGHATRSAVVLSHLLDRGHEIRVVVSGRAHAFLAERFRDRDAFTIEEIHGLTLRYFGNKVDRAGSLFWNLRRAPKAVRKNVRVYRRVAEDGFSPDVVVSDFESFAALYGLRHRVPVISIDNIQILNRCRHPKAVREGKRFDFRLARLAVKAKLPGAYHYFVTTFFYPEVRRKYTTLVPPILRDEVVGLQRTPGEHVVVYQRAVDEDVLVTMLTKLPFDFRVYGADRTKKEKNVALKTFSSAGFLRDLGSARAVIAGGGFSLMSEAVSLGVPMFAVPIEGQYEQELNARYLERLDFGRWSRKLTSDAVASFLDETDTFTKALGKYQREDNSKLFSKLDEILERVRAGKSRA